MLKTFLSIITEVGNRIEKHNASSDEEGEEYDGGLGQPYSHRKWAENYYGKQSDNNDALKKDINHS